MVGNNKTIRISSKKRGLDSYVSDGSLGDVFIGENVHRCELKHKRCNDLEYGKQCHHYDYVTIKEIE